MLTFKIPGFKFIAQFIVILLVASTTWAQSTPRTIHVFVALCDNVNQGIIPVPTMLGNGRDPRNNLYWGAAFGVKNFFKKQSR